MYLKRITLSGFKSFGKKSEISFDAPVTAIVGPNGSGKSNIAEAIRFVLGEQSMKSLRGKSGSDLIFRGSKTLPRQNRAVVSIVFDNRKKIFKLPSDGEGNLNLDFDEITISREVYADGQNRYLLNGSEVRLKDINGLLSSINIGATGHHIISQGEADRVLSASNKERRVMIEDALGLKVYQFRIKESEKKLEKTEINIKEVRLLQREIAPHLKFLKKQVEKLEQAKEIRESLKDSYAKYLRTEEDFIEKEKNTLSQEKSILHSKLKDLSKALEGVIVSVSNNEKERLNQAILEESEKQRAIRLEIDTLSRKLGRIEGMIEIEEQNASKKEEQNSITLSSEKFISLKNIINKEIKEAISSDSVSFIKESLERIKNIFAGIFNEKTGNEERVNKDNILEFKKEKDLILRDISRLSDQEKTQEENINRLRTQIDQEQENDKERERVHFEVKMKERELKSASDLLKIKEESLTKRKTSFEEEVKEGSVLIGASIFNFRNLPKDSFLNISFDEQEENRKKIERMKIRLEDLGGAGGEDVMKEYEEVCQRDVFLSNQIEDLERSIVSLNEIINDLKVRLETEFEEGLKKINTQFDEFFRLMFDGGGASIKIEKPKKVSKEDELEELEEEKIPVSGIEIDVYLPHKKVRDIQMFSGGERSLTSIALLFAMSQVNPPPFLVLDETDAALDESNSRRYGDMIERLSKYSQLAVITHNRETMSRANILYGITVSSDGASKLLSVKFEDAVSIAK